MRSAPLALVLAACSSTSSPPTGPVTLKQVTAEAELITGLEAAGRVGDYLFDNGRVRFMVQAPGSATGWGLYGGSIVDLDRSGPGGDDRLQEIFFQCNLRGFAPDRVEVKSDGSDGGPAVLRMHGIDKGIPLLDAIIPSVPTGLDITVDLKLPKDGDTLEMAFDVLDTARIELRDVSCGVVLLHGDEYAFFLPGSGPAIGSGDMEWIASAAPARASYVLYRKTGVMGVIAAFDEVVPIQAPAQGVFPGGRYTDSVFLSVGTGDVESALAELRKTRGDAAPRTKLEVPVVAAPDRQGLVTVTLRDGAKGAGGDHESQATLDPATGKATLMAPALGMPVVDVRVDGRLVATRPVSGGAVEPVTVNDEGTLRVKAIETDASGRELGPTPAHLFVHDMAGRELLKRYVKAEDSVVLPAGAYEVVLSKGPEHELFRAEVTVPAMGEVSVDARLAHVVDTTGWYTVDTHVHSTKSVDADESLEQRVLGAVGEGLDILLSTDHDVVIDYAPTAARLGLGERLATERGTEISPLYGHFNAWPLPVGRYWEVQWFLYQADAFVRMLDPQEIVELARQKGASVVQVNHPRGGKGAFDYIALDAATNMGTKAFPSADCVELMNGKGGGPVDTVLADLIGAWKHGRRITATAVSDAHGRGSEIGYGRTAIRVGAEDQRPLSLPSVWQALKDGHAVAMIGPFVTMSARAGASEALIGDTLVSNRAPVTLELKVQAPSWMDVDTVELLAEGSVIFRRTLSEGDRDPANPAVRFRGTVTATPAVDGFFLARVTGDGDNEPVMGTRAQTITNPIFVDVAGDGFVFGR